jgi:predicted metal-dependent HD superfamily phosphohydrolase
MTRADSRTAFADAWRDLCRRADLRDQDGRALADLLDRYSKPHRRYHDVDHVLAVLGRLRHRRSAAAGPAPGVPEDGHRAMLPAELAAFLHGAVYDPRASDNEAASAQYAGGVLRELGAPEPLIGRAQQLIAVTATHEVPAADPAAALFVEADLCVLARPAAAYDAYVAAVRAEYAHVDEDSWRIGRAAVLGRLLDRPALFVLPGADREEAQARANVARELEALQG